MTSSSQMLKHRLDQYTDNATDCALPGTSGRKTVYSRRLRFQGFAVMSHDFDKRIVGDLSPNRRPRCRKEHVSPDNHRERTAEVLHGRGLNPSERTSQPATRADKGRLFLEFGGRDLGPTERSALTISAICLIFRAHSCYNSAGFCQIEHTVQNWQSS